VYRADVRFAGCRNTSVVRAGLDHGDYEVDKNLVTALVGQVAGPIEADADPAASLASPPRVKEAGEELLLGRDLTGRFCRDPARSTGCALTP
jgi:hypothetical protein